MQVLSIVYDLAINNALDEDSLPDPALKNEALRQQEALSIVHDFMYELKGTDPAV